jgi:hypothetical protein
MSTDLRHLLDVASEDVPEPDLAQRAWDTAVSRRRVVRRRVLLGAGAATAVAAAVVVRTRTPSDPDPRATPAAAAPRMPSAVVGGARVDLAPSPGDEIALPRYVEADTLALGPLIGFEDALRLPKLGPTTGRTDNDASVRAVLLAWSARAVGLLPVLHTPKGPAGLEYLTCPSVPLVRADPTETGEGMVLDPRAIRVDRRAVVFPQPGEVVVLDARDGTGTRIPVPDETLHRAGWARDARTVVARGLERSWLVDTLRGNVRAAEGPVEPGWVELVTEGTTTSLRTFSGSGELTGVRPLLGPVIEVSGPTVSNTEGWAGAPAYLGQTHVGAIARSQGLVAVQGDLRPTPRVLAATRGPDVPKGAYRPLLWGPRDVLLLESRAFPGMTSGPRLRLLAWDVIGGSVSRIGEVGPVNPTEGGFTGAYAL